MKKGVVGIIPARMGSSRFPGKPLEELLGIPMIEHVYKRVAMCAALSDVYIATCDSEIADSARSFDADVIMTSSKHERASDRVAEAAGSLGSDVEVVVMVQGDEPMTTPAMVHAAVAPLLEDPSLQVVNLVLRISDTSEYHDPNTIKVVMDQHKNALYFSRGAIPASLSAETPSNVYRQVCVIPFTRRSLELYSQLEPTPLEVIESVDMLRFLEHGHDIRLVETDVRTLPVDTRQDLRKVEELLADDPTTESYL